MRFASPEHLASTWAGLLVSSRSVSGDRPARMRAVADLLWDAFSPVGLSWVGFYEIAGPGNGHGAEPGGAMILGPCRNKPACSPIGLHGACGRAWRTRRMFVVTDVARLGESYVACDPRDRSELVVPCLSEDGSCWGVLDADSFEVGFFDEVDAGRVAEFLTACGLGACPTDVDLV